MAAGTRRWALLAAVLALLAERPLAGGRSGDEVIADGVRTRQESFEGATVRTIDVDLARPGVGVEIAAEEIRVRSGVISGRSRPLADWLRVRSAVAGVNGGFFGSEPQPGFREIVGLLKQAGRVRAAAPVYRSRPERRPYAHSAFGITRQGRMRMAWAISKAGSPQQLLAAPGPESISGGSPWDVEQAVGCGPRLVHRARIDVADRRERLVSRGSLPRTFLGFGSRGSSRRLMLCAADGMEFASCARFIFWAFRRHAGLDCSEAMALDGGGSTQAAWRSGGRTHSVPPLLATAVPTAILIHAPPAPRD